MRVVTWLVIKGHNFSLARLAHWHSFPPDCIFILLTLMERDANGGHTCTARHWGPQTIRLWETKSCQQPLSELGSDYCPSWTWRGLHPCQYGDCRLVREKQANILISVREMPWSREPRRAGLWCLTHRNCEVTDVKCFKLLCLGAICYQAVGNSYSYLPYCFSESAFADL